MKKKLRFWKVLRRIALVIVGICLIWAITNQIMTAIEKKKYLPTGQLVKVQGKDIHVYTKGKGKNTILLLSGLGTAAPVLDFEPLIDELSKNNRVVVVEPFGYGWSDITNKDRTLENIISEVRSALRKSNIKGPYILMPHSVSGIYSMYYANKYPDEVKAIIGIDPLFPKAMGYFREPAPTVPTYMTLLAPTGVVRLTLLANPEGYLPVAEEETYTNENLKMMKAISSWKIANKNVIGEAKEINQSASKTIKMSFPSKMPVMIFTRKIDKERQDGKTNITFYENQLSNVKSKKIVVFQAHHYLHWTRYKEMSKYVNDFINTPL